MLCNFLEFFDKTFLHYFIYFKKKRHGLQKNISKSLQPFYQRTTFTNVVLL